MTNIPQLRVAVLDLYDGTENRGMAAIFEILEMQPFIDYHVYDVRAKHEIPGTDYDLYISSGGPGNPLEGDGVWDRLWYSLMIRLWKHNQQQEDKKHVFFICHSFQLICHHLSLGSVVKRNSRSEGIFPVYVAEGAEEDPLVCDLSSPFYVADFRDYQFIEPNHDRMASLNCQLLAIEKDRPLVDLERAVMMVRFSDWWVGTQFHPEASAKSMIEMLESDKRGTELREKKGEEDFALMLDYARDLEKLSHTHDTILPNFIWSCYNYHLLSVQTTEK